MHDLLYTRRQHKSNISHSAAEWRKTPASEQLAGAGLLCRSALVSVGACQGSPGEYNTRSGTRPRWSFGRTSTNKGTAHLDQSFWRRLDWLVANCQLKIDRPKGTAHPRYSAFLYSFDYGYLEGTRSGDGEGIDVWIGTLPEQRVTGILCTVEVEQRDAEVKLLLGCTPQEATEILQSHNVGAQSAILIERPAENTRD